MLVLLVYLIFSMLAVIWFDTTRYIIPNWLVASLIIIYPIGVYLHPNVDWKMAALSMISILAVGYIIFSLKWMGAGDIKLLTACTLWVGPHNLIDFVFLVAVLGGVFALLVAVLRKGLPYLPLKTALPRILRPGEPLPYGVAIALGFLVMLWTGRVAAAL